MINVLTCSFSKCKKPFDVDDMFYDALGNYYLCPKCIGRDYRYNYQEGLKTGKFPKQIRIQTGNFYDYEELVTFFKQWCFCCASRIGELNAFEMKKGARICLSCISTNLDMMPFILLCLSCEGHIHNRGEVYQVLGD